MTKKPMWQRFPKQPMMYVLAIDGPHGSFTGFGVTSSIASRLRVHAKHLAEANFDIKRVVTINFKTDRDAQNAESAIRRLFEITPICVNGFKREATHASAFDSVVSFAESAGQASRSPKRLRLR